eukprot:CAMPEP_0114248906 /NCGR_PEP_ID=MMETSP0058-20121206/13833_1 /TAXON_ID=36894 /ORGANISM="Pyramimonas parkeae, CCMP726" /LENGTH=386 /DNA_ID=CAMNT_0001362365 /DNA_START=78 /DNA_END=1238 /DNA_ORIENTATION=+
MSEDGDYDPEAAEEEQELDLSVPEVVTKYKGAAEICNLALAHLVEEAKVGMKVIDLCTKSDEFLTQKLAGSFNKKNAKGERVEKGIAFPTCVSLNSTVCHFSPCAGDATTIAAGDMVKIDLGCHIDGFIAVGAHTFMMQDGKVSGRAADALVAANTALEATMRMMKPGNKASDIAPVLEKIGNAYNVKVVEGVLSHQMKRFVIDGNKVVLNKTSPEHKAEEAVFEENEVYAVDICYSTGEGKPKVVDEKETTVYKRALDKEYNLKMKASRFVFSEINKRFPTMPFTMRLIEDSGRARLGLVECLNHELLHPYPVLHEKAGDVVAHLKCTVLITANGVDRVTSVPLQECVSESTMQDEEIAKLLQTSLKISKKKKNKKKKEGESMES